MIERPRTAALTGAVTIAAVISPVFQHLRRTPRDSFPLSHYPMFTAVRGETLAVTHLLGSTASGATASGATALLACDLLGPGGMNQHRKQLGRAAARPCRAAKLTDRAARQLVRRSRRGRSDVVTVQLVTCEYRLTDRLAGRLVPTSTEVHACSDVPWGAPG